MLLYLLQNTFQEGAMTVLPLDHGEMAPELYFQILFFFFLSALTLNRSEGASEIEPALNCHMPGGSIVKMHMTNKLSLYF